MRKLFANFVVLSVCLFGSLPQVVAQTSGGHTAPREWTWMGGSNTNSQPGVYGSLRTPATGNIPGAREGISSWIDKSGNLWLFDGWGYDANGNESELNDLWEFNSTTHQWAWMGGSSIGDQAGTYGTLGTPASGNIPGGRDSAASWTDSSGNFWFFGGEGYDANGNWFDSNDLWEFAPSTSQWVWIGGSSSGNQSGVYGTLGIPAAGNVPGGRERAANWIDSTGNLWLFGGFGYDANGNIGDLNDLWEFNPSTSHWTWMGGASTINRSGAYGTLLTPAAGKVPGTRNTAQFWTDSSGNFWLFGGYGYGDNTNTYEGLLDDLWVFDTSTNQWAWMGGSSTINAPSVYGTLGTPVTGNTPGSRSESSIWVDSSDRVWLFGGFGPASVNQLSDLWEFNLSTLQWTWTDGSSRLDLPGVYGTLGTPAASNIPGSRQQALSWTDSSGNLWLFGGFGYDGSYPSNELNDVWEYQPEPAPSTVATPTFNLAPGTYSSPQSVTISDTTANATIYYTTDGSWPTTSSAVYRGPVPVSASEIIKTMATAGGFSQSAVATAAYKVPAAPTLLLTSSLPSSISGQPLAFTATINSGATGYVTFNVNNGMWSIPAPIIGNTAVLDTSELPAGSNTIVASYSGDFNWKAATASLTQVVSRAMPSISLSSSANPSGGSQLVAFTVTLNVTAGITPTGTVTFNVDNGALSIAAPVVGLTAVLDTSYLTVGSHTVFATYSGDSNWNTVTSSSLTQVVIQDTLSLTSSLNPSTVGQPVEFTATINAANGAPKTGTVTFNIDNGASPITAPVESHIAVLDTSNLSAGSHTIVASYSGDGNWAPATSAPITQVIYQAYPTLTLSSSASPSTSGQLVEFTASFKIASGPAPTGVVIFVLDNGAWYISSPINGLTSTFDTSQILVGAHTIYALYEGDNNFGGAQTQLNQTVNAPPSN